DILVRTSGYIYIMELKYDRSAEEALEQIERKEYSLPWSVDSRTVIGIGINYSSEKRRIDTWTQATLPK
ncbi:MAG: PD-(D/E)XK nuclease domain-containing protein, partial [Muribaculaceae bacterium]|nr:PD-(D/E)XK nuclease domain-containing protein [Muribaculaceae bacterium]